MSQTRREFLVISAAALAVTAASTLELNAVTSSPQADAREPDWIIGDPFIASADHVGLGGHSYDDAREAAMRFRCSVEDRERYVLGLEL